MATWIAHLRIAENLLAHFPDLDHIYVRAHPDCLFWRVFLDAELVSADLDFLPPQALLRQMEDQILFPAPR